MNIKGTYLKPLLAALALSAASLPAAAVDIGVSINIGQPDYYGRVDIVDYPAPRLIYADPIVVERVRVVERPVYLRVPPGQAKHWSKHCRQYDACGRPVYFVDDGWYNTVYAPRYRERHERDRHDDDHGRDHDHDNDHDRDDDRGHEKGKGKDRH